MSPATVSDGSGRLRELAAGFWEGGGDHGWRWRLSRGARRGLPDESSSGSHRSELLRERCWPFGLLGSWVC